MFAIDFPAHGTPAVRVAIGSGIHALGHILVRALIMVAHQVEDIGHVQLGLGLDPQRVGLGPGLAAMVITGEVLLGGTAPK